MLIEIDDSVMMALKNENPNDEHVILSLTNLFVSSYQGYHILHASIDSLEYFSKMNLGKIAQTTIQTLIKKYSSYVLWHPVFAFLPVSAQTVTLLTPVGLSNLAFGKFECTLFIIFAHNIPAGFFLPL